MRLIAPIILQIVRIEDRGNGDIVTLADGSEDRRYADDMAAVVFDRVDRGKRGLARGNGRGEDQHMLVLDHRAGIIAEHHLSVAHELRREDIDGVVSVQIHEARVGQLLSDKGADDLGTVQTDDRVDDGVGAVEGHDLLRDRLCLRHTEFLGRDVDIVVGMAVHRREMPLLHTQEQFGISGSDLEFFRHKHPPDGSTFLGLDTRVCMPCG